ncbi:CvpA family protein [Ectothiorhodospira lacustris]|uniref:CvpA family protein n=1 Tax=Ectothiorhodospira lacustris TaxID=2899127 RepID=UPI001EE804BE|nr:CvpA family protein [Ectothiorhodospira lacustris]MCG5500408.1 CvpA family protein [Ectothiorhodospira lacustris]MCG5510431.1 CvpA family protein [Ectothiorhodospira lacustris]MCG5522177.1 CvpA family protein [Ectothiorhodospira lacustris]
MIWIDFVILGIVAVSTVISLFRGFVKEAISLATWILAFWVSLAYSGVLAGHLPFGLEDPTLRLGIAFAILFIVTLLVGGIVNVLAGQMVKKTGLSGTDRSIGAVFGLARGGLIVAVVILLMGLTVIPQEPWWQESLLVPHFERIALWLRDYLPPDLASHFSFGG